MFYFVMCNFFCRKLGAQMFVFNMFVFDKEGTSESDMRHAPHPCEVWGV